MRMMPGKRSARAWRTELRDAPGAALDAVLDATLGTSRDERKENADASSASVGLKLLKGTPARKADEVEERMAADQAVSRLDIG